MSSPIDVNEIEDRWSNMPDTHWCIDDTYESIRHVCRNSNIDVCDLNYCKYPHFERYDGNTIAYAPEDINNLLKHIDNLNERNKRRIDNLKKLLKDVEIDTCHTEDCDDWYVFEDHLEPLGFSCEFCSRSWCYNCVNNGKINPIEYLDKNGHEVRICSGNCIDKNLEN